MIATIRKLGRVLDREARRRLWAIVLLSAAVAGLEAVGIGLVLPFIESLTRPNQTSSSSLARTLSFLPFIHPRAISPPVLGTLILGLFLTRSALAVAVSYWQIGVVTGSEARLATRLLARYMRAPYTVHLRRNSAELVRNVQISVNASHANALQGFLTSTAEAVVVAAVVLVLFALEPMVAGATTALLIVIGIIYHFALGRWARAVGAATQELSRSNYQGMQQSLGGLKESRVLGRVAYFIESFDRDRRNLAHARHHQLFMQLLPRHYLEGMMVVVVAVITVLVVGGRDEGRSLAVLGLFVTAGFRLIPSLNRLLVGFNNVKVGAAAVDALHHDLTDPGLEPDEEAEGAPIPFHDSIRLDDVSYLYDGTSEVALKHITLSIQRGESVGLVGSSGAGKSTLVDILLGLLLPTHGAVLIDDQPLNPDRVADWRSQVGYVPQVIYLTDDSLRRNIALGLHDHEIDERRVMDAVALAQLDALVARLPDGLDTKVGERGARLSGGERQRIGIARALFRNPRVLILDEATSALDNDTEERIMSTVNALKARMTLITIAHRLSSLRWCDRLFLLDQGRLVSSGAFDQLVADDPGFADLVRLGDIRSPLRGGE